MNIKRTVLLASVLVLFSAFYTQQTNAFAYKYYAKKAVGTILSVFCAGSVAELVDPEGVTWFKFISDKGYYDFACPLYTFCFPANILRAYFTDDKDEDSQVKAMLVQLGFIAATGYGSYKLLTTKKKRRRIRKRVNNFP